MSFIRKEKGTWKTISCPICKYSWEFDEKKIPLGATYEVQCKKCYFVSKRKRME